MKRKEWLQLFIDKQKGVYSRGNRKRAESILKRITSTKANIVSRSKEKQVECKLQLDELRQLFLDNLWSKDKYFPDRLITEKNINIDHLVPLHLGGNSNIENLQVITKYSNQIKSWLTEEDLYLLIKTINLLPKELAKSTFKRLASNNKY